MDRFDFSDLAAVSQQTLFGTYPPQPSTIKRQQTYQPNFSTPVYNSIEDWSAAELTTDSAPSPGTGSPVSPVFTGFSFSNPAPGTEDWAAWDKIEQSPESDFFLKSELLESPDLTSIPIMSPSLDAGDIDLSTNPVLDDVVFGREGVNDTRPLFQTPLSLTMPQQAQQQQQQPPLTASTSTTKSSSSSSTTKTGLPTNPEASTTSTQERRYPARASLKRKSSDCSSRSSSSRSSPRSSCSPPPPQRRHTSSSNTSHHHHHKDEHHHNSGSCTKPALGPKKTAHNMIEKRYRTNLNDKIAALRDSVPALRVMVHRLEHNTGGVDGLDQDGDQSLNIMDEIKAEAGGLEAGMGIDEDLGGLTPAHKLNKATILSKATEYIAHLERKNRSLAKENSQLRNRVEGFEMLVMSRSGGQQQRSVWN